MTSTPWELDLDTLVISGGAHGLGRLGAALERQGSLDIDYSSLAPEQPQRLRLRAPYGSIETVIVASVRERTDSKSEAPASVDAARRAASAALRLACETGSRGIAMPLLGAGLARLSLGAVADAVVGAVRSELEAIPKANSPSDVVFIAFDELEEAALRAAWAGHRPQAMANDRPEGPDLLGIRAEVAALADMLLLRDVQPPLAVGVLGTWGSGKSFVLELMRQQMEIVRRRRLSSGQWASHGTSPFVGHVYPIEFNAWTYARADLWAALMQRVLTELDRQLRVEGQLAAMGDDLLDGERWFEVTRLPEEMHRLYAAHPVQDTGNLFSALSAIHRDDRAALAEQKVLLTELEGAEGKRREELREQIDRESKAQIDRASWLPLRTLVAKTVGATDSDVLQWIARDAPELRDALSSGRASIGEARAFASALRELRPPAHRVAAKVVARERLAAVVFAVCAIATPELVVRASSAGVALPAGVLGSLAAASSLARLATDWTRVLRRFADQVNPWRQGVEDEISRIDANNARLLDAEADKDEEIQRNRDEIIEAELEVERLRQRVGLVDEFESIGEFVSARLRSGTYDERLGMMHTVSTDLRALSKSLTVADDDAHEDEKRERFPRGPARVALFIDDLDRCPPAKVVEVLEAVQLLLATDLFVVVIALDVRYVTKALEKVYEGVLSPDGKPSGIDYLEKIVQIPYRTRGLRPETAGQFISGQLRTASLPDRPAGPDAEAGVAVEASRTGHHLTDDQTARELLFDPADVQVVAEVCAALELTPRSAKRVTNVTKLFHMVSAKRGDGTPRPFETAAVALLVGLAACHPDVQRDALAALSRASSRETLLRSLEAALTEEGLQIPDQREAWTTMAAALAVNVERQSIGQMTVGDIAHVVDFVSAFSFRPD